MNTMFITTILAGVFFGAAILLIYTSFKSKKSVSCDCDCEDTPDMTGLKLSDDIKDQRPKKPRKKPRKNDII